MNPVPRWRIAAAVGVLAALLGYFGYSPAPEIPRLSGTMIRGTMTVGGLKRTYRTYVPRGLAKGAPVVVVMHGAGENGARIRIETGYGFERLADEHGFAVVYPNADEGRWALVAKALETQGAQSNSSTPAVPSASTNGAGIDSSDVDSRPSTKA